MTALSGSKPCSRSLSSSAPSPLHQPKQLLNCCTWSIEKPEGASHVAHGALAAIADDGGGDGRALAAVLAVHVLDDFLAPLVLEINVDIRRLVAFAAK